MKKKLIDLNPPANKKTIEETKGETISQPQMSINSNLTASSHEGTALPTVNDMIGRSGNHSNPAAIFEPMLPNPVGVIHLLCGHDEI